LSISPFQIGWSRTILTESLVIPLTIFLFSEIIKALSQKKIDILPWSLILIFAIFTRYDMIVFCLAVPLVAFSIYSPKIAIQKTVLIGILVCLPLSVWVARSLSYDLRFPPNPATAINSVGYPSGIIAWSKTWSDSSIDNPTFIWKMNGAQYSLIHLSDKMYNNKEEKELIIKNFNNLKEFDGYTVPKHIDNMFAKLANKRIMNDPVNYWIYLPIKRVMAMISDLPYSNNLPIILGANESIKIQNRLSKAEKISDFFEIVIDYPNNTLTRVVLASYKIIIFSLFLYLFVTIKKSGIIESNLIKSSTVLSLASLLFIVIFGNSTETRYLLTPLVCMELTIMVIFLEKQNNNQLKLMNRIID